jgi:hypothetical protein
MVATAITGLMFFLDHHLSHSYATLAFLPFFMAVSAVHARLVFWTGSILPSIVLHSTLDALVIPIQYGLVGSLPSSSVREVGIDASFVAESAVLILCGLAALPAFRKLAGAARRARSQASPPGEIHGPFTR